jgi:LacI family transcriptional regulator
MVTIKEVAKKAGVSVGTVSNVLNGLSTVTVGNRAKVKRVMEELGYVPSKIAASLSNKKTRNIGLIVSDISSPFYSELIKSISHTLEAYGYNVYLCGSGDDIEKEESLIRNLISMWVDGIIIIPSYSDARDVDFLNCLEIPVVLVNREIQGIKRDVVVFDNFKGAYQGVRLLLETGCRKIALLTGPRKVKSSIERHRGWKKALEEEGAYDKRLEFWGDYTVESGKEMAHKALENVRGLDCFFATSDLIALGAMKEIKERKLLVPKEISVLGFGDIMLSKYLDPSLSTVRRPFDDIGKLTALIMVERLNSKKDFSQKKILVDGEVILRDSVKKIP